jgi:tetratricopeptide (TPR) repeat protein
MRLSRVIPAFLFLFLLLGFVSVSAQTRTELSFIGPGPSVIGARCALPAVGATAERGLNANEAHQYEVRLAAGEFLEVVVEKRGLDVVVEVIDPMGKPALRVNSPTGKQGREVVYFVAPNAGVHFVKVWISSGESRSDAAGQYLLKVSARRTATERDRALAEALKTLRAGLNEYFTGPRKAQGILNLAEKALSVFIPANGFDDPNTFQALVLYVRVASRKEEWIKAAAWLERVAEAREKLPDHTVAELCDVLEFARELYSKAGECEFKIEFERVSLRQLGLLEGIAETDPKYAWANRREVRQLLHFYEKCAPEKSLPFAKQHFEQLENRLGDLHPKVLDDIKVFVGIFADGPPEPINWLVERKLALHQGGTAADRAAQVKILRTFGEAFDRRWRGPDLDGELFSTMPVEEAQRVREKRMDSDRKRALEFYERARVAGEQDRLSAQADYAFVLTELLGQGGGPDGLESIDRLIAFGEEVRVLDGPELIEGLSELFDGFLRGYESDKREDCLPRVKKRREKTRQYLLRIGESMFRLAESSPPSTLRTKKLRPGSDSDEHIGDVLRPGVANGFAIQYARFRMSENDPEGARKALERGLAIDRKQDDPLGILLTYAVGFDLAGDEKAALALYEEARKSIPADGDHVEWAIGRVALRRALFHERQGDYAGAEQTYRNFVAEVEKVLKRDEDGSWGDDGVERAFAGLIWVAAASGDEKKFEAAKAEYRKEFPINIRVTPNLLEQVKTSREWAANWLMYHARTYEQFGNRERAESLVQRMLAATGEGAEFDPALGYAAGFYLRVEKYPEAVPILERLILQRLKGNVAWTEPMRPIGLYARLVQELRYPARGMAFLERITAEFEKKPDSAPALQYLYVQLLRCYEAVGNAPETARIQGRLLALERQSPATVPVSVSDQIALAEWRAGNIEAAIQLQAKVNGTREQRFIEAGFYPLVFGKPTPYGDEQEIEGIFCKAFDPPSSVDSTLDLEGELDRTISLHALFAPKSEPACRMALESALRRRNRTLAMIRETGLKLNEPLTPEDKSISDRVLYSETARSTLWVRETLRDHLDFWSLPDTGNSDMEGLTSNSEDWTFHRRYEPLLKQIHLQESPTLLASSQVSPLWEMVQSLLVRHPKWKPATIPVSLDDVQKSLPADTALVEIVRYAPFNPKTGTTEGEERYAVYVLNPQGEPKWFDGGTVSEVDRSAILLANEARDYADDESKAATAVLESRFIAPALKLTGNAKRVYVAFDERLASLPLKKLVNAEGKPFGESRGLIFIRSGRELLTMNKEK